MTENKGIMLAKSVQKHAGRAKEKVSSTPDALCNAHATPREGHETHHQCTATPFAASLANKSLPVEVVALS